MRRRSPPAPAPNRAGGRPRSGRYRPGLSGPRGTSPILTTWRRPPRPVVGSCQGMRASIVSRAAAARISRGQYSLGLGRRGPGDRVWGAISPSMGPPPFGDGNCYRPVVNAINQPSRQTAVAFVFAWLDTRENRRSDARAYAILNDADRRVNANVLEALEGYQVRPIRWSERESVVRELVT